MNAILRHMAVRLWLTVSLGGLISLSFLPHWQRPFGVEWLVLPAAAILAVCFLGTGWVMNRLGRFFLERTIREAAVWERSGMEWRARAAYERVAALFDSFWLSPLQRRRSDRSAGGQLIRFHLAQPELSTQSRRVLATYFRRTPQDATAAEGWLEHLLEWEDPSPEEHDAAGKLADTLAEHGAVQRRLMRFFLASRRIDYIAMRTYRRVWSSFPEMGAVMAVPLAKLLLGEALLNDWTLEVYLKAYEAGAAEALEGIAAAVRYLRPDGQNRHLLSQAREICARAEGGVPSLRRFSAPSEKALPKAVNPPRLASAPAPRPSAPPSEKPEAQEIGLLFPKPAEPPVESEPLWRFQAGEIDADNEKAEDETALELRKQKPQFVLLKENLERLGRTATEMKPRFAKLKPNIQKLKPSLEKLKPGPEHKERLNALGRGAEDLGRRLWKAGSKSTASMAERVRDVVQTPRALTLAKISFFSAAAVLGVVMVIGAWRYLTPPRTIVSEPERAVVPAVTDPFTIQVAAYIRPEEAKRFTERLRKQGLDAFIAVAGTSDRKWYQVKISHFATRAAAREFGEQLKTKGLIDDFYVANYAAGEILRSSP